jgi:hypothetical protein
MLKISVKFTFTNVSKIFSLKQEMFILFFNEITGDLTNKNTIDCDIIINYAENVFFVPTMNAA